jgi:multidrug efflux system membrane fusion protein
MLDKSEQPVVEAKEERVPTRPGRSWRSRLFSILIGCVVIGAVVLWVEGPWQQQHQRQGSGRFRGGDGPVPVLAKPAATADVPVYLDGVGTTKALNTVTVRPQVDGKLIKVLFTEGQDVERGYVLAEIDPTTYQAQLDQAVAKKAQDEAQLANAKIDLDRYARLAVSNAGSKQQVDTQRAQVAQLEAQVKLDQAAIENAQAILGYTKIVAPIAGRTGLRQVDEGNIVHASDATGIVVITQLKPISIFFSVPQQQLNRVNKAFGEGTLAVEALGPDNKTVVDRGTLKVIDNQVDQTTGTVKVRAEFPNPGLQLWPGQFINVRLLVETLKQVVTVPTAAVQRGPNGTFVYVVKDDNTVAVRAVTVTQQDDVRAVVTDGVKQGERVVTSGFVRLTDAAKVTVSTGDGPQPPPAAAAKPDESAPAKNGEGRRGERRRQRSGAGSGASQ